VPTNGDGVFLHAAILHQNHIHKTCNRHDELILFDLC
jgi:hypothetical protein